MQWELSLIAMSPRGLKSDILSSNRSFDEVATNRSIDRFVGELTKSGFWPKSGRNGRNLAEKWIKLVGNGQIKTYICKDR